MKCDENKFSVVLETREERVSEPRIPRGMAFIEKTFFGWFTIEKKQLSYCLFFLRSHMHIHNTHSHKRVEYREGNGVKKKNILKKYVDVLCGGKLYIQVKELLLYFIKYSLRCFGCELNGVCVLLYKRKENTLRLE